MLAVSAAAAGLAAAALSADAGADRARRRPAAARGRETPAPTCCAALGTRLSERYRSTICCSSSPSRSAPGSRSRRPRSGPAPAGVLAARRPPIRDARPGEPIAGSFGGGGGRPRRRIRRGRVARPSGSRPPREPRRRAARGSSPIANADELLGLVVAERGPEGEPFAESEDRAPRRARPPGRPGAAQRPARLAAAGVAARAPAPGRAAPGIARPRRHGRGRRAASHRARPPRRRPAAPRGARASTSASRASWPAPTRPRRRRSSSSSGDDVDAARRGAARARPRHLPAAARRPRAARGPVGGGRRARRSARGSRRARSAATPRRSRRRSTSAASRRCRTRASTPAAGATATVRVWEERERCASRSPTTAPASTPAASRAGPGSRTWPTGSGRSAAACGSRRRRGRRRAVTGTIPLRADRQRCSARNTSTALTRRLTVRLPREPELLEDRVDVLLHRRLGDDQRRGDGRVVLPPSPSRRGPRARAA